jgi:hypothetical protein
MRVLAPVSFLLTCPMRETEHQGADVERRRNSRRQMAPNSETPVKGSSRDATGVVRCGDAEGPREGGAAAAL